MDVHVSNASPNVTKTMTFGILETKHAGPVPGTGACEELRSSFTLRLTSD